MITKNKLENLLNSNNSVKNTIKYDKKAIAKEAKQNFREILDCLEKVDRKILLILKVNEYLHQINTLYGHENNYLYYTTKYAYK